MENNKPIAPVEHKSFLVWAILSSIFCCTPFGIPSIVYAAIANSKHDAGDDVAAAEANAKAKKWFWWAFGCGIAFWVLYLIYMIVLLVALNEYDAYDYYY